MSDRNDNGLRRLTALAEPVRRALYRWVVAQPAPVTRDEAAASVGVPRHVAKFNLDRLVDEGLLDADYQRPPGRRGPGAGRPAKVYRRAATEIEVSLPERRYDVAGLLLARAVAEAERHDEPVTDALPRVARAHGRAVAAAQSSRRSSRRQLLDALDANGYEPRDERGVVTFTNCPFHVIADEETELVCSMNLALVQGIVDELGVDADTRLQPMEGGCCVRIDTRRHAPRT